MPNRIVARSLVVFAAAIGLTMGAPTLSAQEPEPLQAEPTQPTPTRPDQGVFRDAPVESEGHPSLFFTGSLFQNHDENRVGTVVGDGDSRLRSGGPFTSGQLGLSFSQFQGGFRFESNGTATYDYYPRLSGELDQPIAAYYGHAAVDVPFGETNLRFDQTISYQPYFNLDSVSSPFGQGLPPLTSAEIGVAADSALFSDPVTQFGSNASFTAPVSRRASVGALYGYHGSTGSDLWTDVTDHGGGLNLTMTTGRRSSINASYGYRVTSYTPPGMPTADITTQDFQVGYTYRRQLARTRSLALDGGVGVARLTGAPREGFEKQSQFIIRGGVNYQLGRSWTVQADARRSLQVLLSLAQPFFGNSVNGSVNGLLTRRVEFRASAGYSTGNVDITSFGSGYDTGTGSGRVRYALGRSTAISAEYIYTRYSLGREVVLPPGVVRELARHIIRAGITVGVPLVGGSRSAP